MYSTDTDELHAKVAPQLDLASSSCRTCILAQEDIAQEAMRDVDDSVWEEVEEEEGGEKGEEEEVESKEKAHGQRETVNSSSGAGEDVGGVRRRRRKRVKTQGERASTDALLRQVVLDYCSGFVGHFCLDVSVAAFVVLLCFYVRSLLLYISVSNSEGGGGSVSRPKQYISILQVQVSKQT